MKIPFVYSDEVEEEKEGGGGEEEEEEEEESQEDSLGEMTDNGSSTSSSSSSGSGSVTYSASDGSNDPSKCEMEIDGLTESEGSQNGSMKNKMRVVKLEKKKSKKVIKKARRGQAIEYRLAEVGSKATNRFRKVIIRITIL